MKIFGSIIMIGFLFSCGETDDIVRSSNLVTHSSTNFSVNIPGAWKIIDKDDTILPKPNTGKISLAVSSATISGGVANNFLILSTPITSFVSSKEYAIVNNIGAQQKYLEYTKLGEKEIVFADGQVSILYSFEAKYRTDTSRLKFLQTARICHQKIGYLLTLAVSSSTDDIEKYEEILTSFNCK